jgi:Ca2+-binding RTX toxin-like protein
LLVPLKTSSKSISFLETSIKKEYCLFSPLFHSTDNPHDRPYQVSGYDVIYGGQGNDRLTGGFNNDVLEENEGNDTLYGGWHNGTLAGGTGDDTLIGGPGYNFFDCGGGHDVVKDFHHLTDEQMGAKNINNLKSFLSFTVLDFILITVSILPSQRLFV